MLLYKQTPRFNPYTGLLDETLFAYLPDRILCDYTGEIFEINDVDIPQYSLKFKYNHDSEPDWSEDNIKELTQFFPDAENFCFRSFLFEDQEFHFASGISINYIDESGKLFKEWDDNINNRNSIFFNCITFAQACRISRIRVLTDLFKTGKLNDKDIGYSSNVNL